MSAFITRSNLILFVASIFLSLFASVARSSDISAIGALEASKLVAESKAILVDVRETDETKSGMAAPALLMPLSEMQKNTNDWKKFVKELPKEKTIIVYCKVGGRANTVGQTLLALGFKVKNMGGFSSWSAAGLPTKKQ